MFLQGYDLNLLYETHRRIGGGKILVPKTAFSGNAVVHEFVFLSGLERFLMTLCSFFIRALLYYYELQIKNKILIVLTTKVPM